MSDVITCTKCGREFPVAREVEAAERGNWTCHICAAPDIKVDLLDVIKRGISVKGAETENVGRFVLRELVQNADDAGASIIVLRFERDALYASNDGRAFTTTTVGEKLCDFDAISSVLRQTKAEDKETTGHFGSGFQTVYVVTNAPEVHSSGRSGRMDPVQGRWSLLVPGDPRRLVSPFVWRGEGKSRGVLFRFPWRDEGSAMQEYGGQRPFSKPEEWRRWDRDSIRKMYEDLREYIHPVLLCCNRLAAIRLVWAADGALEAYQAERDFALTEVRQKAFVGSVREGFGNVRSEWFTWDSRSDDAAASKWVSFQVESWKWGRDARHFQYLIRSGYATDSKGDTLYVGRGADGGIAITYHPEELQRVLKLSDVHLLFCLFDSTEAFRGDGRAFLYSVIPLPKRSDNRFVFSAHFFPTEDRMDVSVSAMGGKDGEWHRDVVLSIGRLYRETFPLFVQTVQNLPGVSAAAQQAIILNGVPGLPLHEWMRPGKDKEISHWARDLSHEIMVVVLRQPILFSLGQWSSPAAAHWASQVDASGYRGVDEAGARVIALMGHVPFTREFVEHPHFRSTLERNLTNRGLTAPTFASLFQTFLAANGGKLAYGKKTKDGGRLTKEDVKVLIEFCVTRPGSWTETKGLPVVPGKDGVLRPLHDYKIVPAEFAALRTLVPASMEVHEDFGTWLAEVDKDQRTLRPDLLVRLVSNIAEANKERFATLRQEDHRAISQLLVALAKHRDFKLKDVHAGSRFIPTRIGDNVVLGDPNSEMGPDGQRRIFDEHRAERYRRDFIFLPPESSIPGLTQEVKDRIRFLDLCESSTEDLEAVGRMLDLFGLQEGPVPTNYVRHFLSDRHKSLFRDEILGPFLGVSDRKLMDRQKRSFLQAFEAYYAPEELSIPRGMDRHGKTEEWLRPHQVGQIPCLYDAKATWDEPVDFAMELTPDLEILGYKALHSDFNDWDPKTLDALGVERRPQSPRIVDQVTKLVQDAKRNRQILADIVAMVLRSAEPWTDALRELESLAWIPTADGGFRRPAEALLRTRDNEQLLGEVFNGFFDLGACSRSMRERIQHDSAALREDRAKELDMAVDPTLSMLMEQVSRLAGAGGNPPPGLFRRLANKVGEQERLAPTKGFYHHDGRWWDGIHIVISDDHGLRTILGENILVIARSGVTWVEPYLRYIGAHSTPGPAMILERMAEVTRALSKEGDRGRDVLIALWDRLESELRAGEQPPRGQGQRIAYPVPDGHVAPTRLVVLAGPGARLFERDGWYGEWYVVSESSCAHPKAVRALGAKTPSELITPEIREIIESLRATGREMDRLAADTAARLLVRMCGSTALPGLAADQVWPAVRGGVFSLERLDGCFIRDHPAASQFEGEFTFLHDSADPQVRQALRNLALACGGTSRLLSRHINEEFGGSGAQIPDAGLSMRLRMMADALRLAYPGAYAESAVGIDWLKAANAFLVDRLWLQLTVGGRQRQVETPCLILGKNGIASVLRVRADPSLPDRLAAAIVLECERRGFPFDATAGSGASPLAKVVRWSDLESMVYRLLTRDPAEWGIFVKDMGPPEEWAPPLVEIDLETRQGYAETRQKLLETYGRCQICGRTTPASESPDDVCETVRSVVSMKGGRYWGRFDAYTLGNSLFLCPSHHVLFVRKLVRLPDLERALTLKEEGARMLKAMAERRGSPNFAVEVFEARRKDSEPAPRWCNQTLTLTAEHAKAMLNWLADWIERESR